MGETGVQTGYGGYLYNLGYFDRIGAVPIFFSGAMTSLVAAAVIGPRYGVFMPTQDQQKISGNGSQEKTREKGIMHIMHGQREKHSEIDELYLHKIRKLIKRELTQSNVETGINLL